ncbi:MAG: GNAT family N-acetyltransferase [Bacteroides sp.]|nr:GNAT family N-acetyltransferase [Prevotella sp.]MCM1407668.1 GNAT family N-acetyltransferase [Treponema brennaborense]MCM1469182.1 GNAT family N-acetyltransferase [Bacteroides sp.]
METESLKLARKKIQPKGKENSESGHLYDAYIRRLVAVDLDKVTALQDYVKRTLENQQWFAPSSHDCIAELLAEPSVYAPGVFVHIHQKDLLMSEYPQAENLAAETFGDVLVGFWFSIPWKNNEENYGYDLNLSEQDLLQCVNFELAVVHPEWRGNGLQKMLLERCLDYQRRRGFSIAAAVTAPDNIFSRRNIESLGFSEFCRKEKYGGYYRSVLWRKL